MRHLAPNRSFAYPVALQTLRITVLASFLGSVAAQDPVEEGVRIDTWPDGSVRSRTELDDEGRPLSLIERFRQDGSVEVRGHYRHGERDGTWIETDPDGTRRLLETWRKDQLHGRREVFAPDGTRSRLENWHDGLLHGKLKITQGRKTLGRQTWKDGLLAELERLAPFPRGEPELREQLTAILSPPAADAPQAPSADQLAGFDDARFRQGYEGASKSNLSGGGMLGSVDAYMNDSDPSNIDRIGHRRWCLNPGMKRTAFGEHQRYSAMWSMDGSGKPARDLDAVLYPPPGHVPVDFFGARHAWSIAALRGKALKADDVQISIRPLDDWWLPAGDGKRLQLDHLGVAGGGYGAGPCLVFRPVGLVVRPGARYLVEVRSDGGETLRWNYVVAFCAPIRDR